MCPFNLFICLSKMCHFLLLRGGAPPFSTWLMTFSLTTWKSILVWIKFYRDGFLTPENQKKKKKILKQLHVNLISAYDSISGSTWCRNVRLAYSLNHVPLRVWWIVTNLAHFKRFSPLNILFWLSTIYVILHSLLYILATGKKSSASYHQYCIKYQFWQM